MVICSACIQMFHIVQFKLVRVSLVKLDHFCTCIGEITYLAANLNLFISAGSLKHFSNEWDVDFAHLAVGTMLVSLCSIKGNVVNLILGKQGWLLKLHHCENLYMESRIQFIPISRKQSIARRVWILFGYCLCRTEGLLILEDENGSCRSRRWYVWEHYKPLQ